MQHVLMMGLCRTKETSLGDSRTLPLGGFVPGTVLLVFLCQSGET